MVYYRQITAFTFKCVGMSRICKAFSVQYVHSLWCFTGINTWERRIHSPLRLFLTPPTPVYLFLAVQIWCSPAGTATSCRSEQMWRSRTAGMESDSHICLAFPRHRAPHFICRHFLFFFYWCWGISELLFPNSSTCARVRAWVIMNWMVLWLEVRLQFQPSKMSQ